MVRHSEEFRCSIMTKMMPPEDHHVSKNAKGTNPSEATTLYKGRKSKRFKFLSVGVQRISLYYRKPSGEYLTLTFGGRQLGEQTSNDSHLGHLWHFQTLGRKHLEFTEDNIR